MSNSELIVHSTPMVEVDGEANIPTVVTYVGGKPLIGHEALRNAQRGELVLNEDFKLDLGNYDPSTTRRKRFATQLGAEKSAAEITSDFIGAVLGEATKWLSFNGLDLAPSLLLAEPLKDPTAPDWIRNYRANLERILVGKGFPKSKIDFLPEPFAVFQYYRYGYRHPALADKRIHRALVLDFGGGTFDACVVESKKDGDISLSGRNSNPLAASSSPIGGFEINRQIAEHIAFQTHQGIDAKIKKGLEVYKRWRRSPEDLGSYSAEYSAFVTNFHRLVHNVEAGKIAMSRNVTNWSLTRPPTFTFPFRAPANLFEVDSKQASIQVKAADVLTIFSTKLWPNLRKTIEQTIKLARQEMANAPINVILLSGGSSSFGWLRELLKRDFPQEYEAASLLTLPDYREVVAKGLAIECARRFYVDRGDFGTVTYNRLCLTLEADAHGQDVPKYSPRFGAEKASLPDGVLLPSSMALGGLIDQPLRWKFRLDHPPKKKLNYSFLRSSFDPDDLENLQNVQDRTVFTPSRASFDSQLQVELTVSQDGTALPRFVYKTGRDGADELIVQGRPFYLDMTNVGNGSMATAYLGIDFGTSNSAIAFLSEQTMDRHKVRSADADWLSLHELVAHLPYPLAKPLSRVMGGTASVQSEEGFLRVMEFIEACFSMLAYAAYVEKCSLLHGSSRLFKGYTQRSVGPLWALLRDCLTAMGKKAVMLAPALTCLQAETKSYIDRLVGALNDRKHHKGLSPEIDLMDAMTFIGNICHEVFSQTSFGFFEGVQKRRFSKDYCGRFRVAHGAVQPFSLWFSYEGKDCFADYQPFLIHLATSTAIGIEPLLFWDHAEERGAFDDPLLFFLDKSLQDGCAYKACGLSASLNTTDSARYCELGEAVTAWKEQDPELDACVLTKLVSMHDLDVQT